VQSCISWALFVAKPIVDMTTFLAAADRFLRVVNEWYGDRPVFFLCSLVERLRTAITPNPNRADDTELGLQDAVDIINYGLYML
jgi:hypothetical protein